MARFGTECDEREADLAQIVNSAITFANTWDQETVDPAAFDDAPIGQGFGRALIGRQDQKIHLGSGEAPPGTLDHIEEIAVVETAGAARNDETDPVGAAALQAPGDLVGDIPDAMRLGDHAFPGRRRHVGIACKCPRHSRYAHAKALRDLSE